MEMIELKRKPPEEKKAETSDCCEPGMWPHDQYPVSMYMGNDQLEQLGLATMEVGKEMVITCRVKVRSFSSSETDKGTQKNAELSVMAMAIQPEGPPAKSAAQALYGAEDA